MELFDLPPLFWIVLLWALIATTLLFRNPFPIPDKGHRLVGVSTREAQDLLLQILAKHGLHLRLRFKTGPTIQALLSDNMTVIHHVPADFGATGNGLSVAVSDPAGAAAETVALINSKGYTAKALDFASDIIPPNNLVLVQSEIFNGWALVFRRHVFRMPRPERVA